MPDAGVIADERVQDIGDAVVDGLCHNRHTRHGIKEHRAVDADDVGIGNKRRRVLVDKLRIPSGGHGDKTALGLKIPDRRRVFRCDLSAVVGDRTVDVGEDQIAFEFLSVHFLIPLMSAAPGRSLPHASKWM